MRLQTPFIFAAVLVLSLLTSLSAEARKSELLSEVLDQAQEESSNVSKVYKETEGAKRRAAIEKDAEEARAGISVEVGDESGGLADFADIAEERPAAPAPEPADEVAREEEDIAVFDSELKDVDRSVSSVQTHADLSGAEATK